MVSPATSKIFTREATGLVRSVSSIDLLIFGIALFGYQFDLYFMANLAPVIGGNLGIGFILFFIPMAAFTLIYYVFTTIMPRSGGDYVFVSRMLHPSLGFVSNLSFTVSIILFVSINAGLIFSVALPILFGYLGVIYNVPSWTNIGSTLSNPYLLFSGGLLIIVVAGLGALRSVRFYLAMQKLMFIAIIAGAIALVVGLLLTSHNSFVSSFNAFSSSYTGKSFDYYDNVTSTAKAVGWSLPDTTSLLPSLMLFPVLGPIYFNYVTVLGGEVRQAKKSILVSVVGGTLIVYVGYIVTLFLLYNVAGFTFLSSINYLIFNAPSKIPLPAIPYAGLLVSIGTNPVIATIINLCSLVQLIAFIPGVYIMASRSFFAYSFDRVLPSWFSEVSKRTNSPTNAVLASIIVAVIFFFAITIPLTAPYIFLLTSIAAVWGAIFPLSMLAISAILLPRSHPKYQALSPMKGLPLQLAGLIALAFMILLLYLELTFPIYGANNPFALGLMVVSTLLVGLIYIIARVRRGAEFGLAFKEIPPE